MEFISKMQGVNLFDSSKSCQSEQNWRSGRRLRRPDFREGVWRNFGNFQIWPNIDAGQIATEQLGKTIVVVNKDIGSKTTQNWNDDHPEQFLSFSGWCQSHRDAWFASRVTFLWCISRKWKYIKYSFINRFFVDWWKNDTCIISPTSCFVKSLGSPQVKKSLSHAELDRQLK